MWFHLLPYVESDNVYKSTLLAIQHGSVIPAYNAPADPFNSDNAGIVNFAGNIRVFGHETIGPEKANEPGVAIEVPEGRLKSSLTLPRIVNGTTNVIMLTTPERGSTNALRERRPRHKPICRRRPNEASFPIAGRRWLLRAPAVRHASGRQRRPAHRHVSDYAEH